MDREDELIRKASRALEKLMEYRRRSAAKTAARAALDDVVVTLRLSQWPERQARRAARQLLAAGVTPAGARVIFASCEERLQ
jgi:hypothetical protein